MASTNETPVLKLPQFVGTDKPSWLGDFNGAMTKIDTAVGDNTGKIAGVETVANAAQAKADSADAAVTALGSEVNRIATEVDAQASEIDALQSSFEGMFVPRAYGYTDQIDDVTSASKATGCFMFLAKRNGSAMAGLCTVYQRRGGGHNITSDTENVAVIGNVHGNPFNLPAQPVDSAGSNGLPCYKVGSLCTASEQTTMWAMYALYTGNCTFLFLQAFGSQAFPTGVVYPFLFNGSPTVASFQVNYVRD